MKIKLGLIFILGLFNIFFSCNDPNKSSVKPAAVTFFNESGLYVDLYMNDNPSLPNPAALLYSFHPAETKKIELYPSFDQVFGDTFYPQYKMFDKDIQNIFYPAQRTLTNLTFVIESGEKYTKTIPHPNSNDLSFYHSYLILTNQTNSYLQVNRGTNVLSKMDDKAVFLDPWQTGYYIIEFNALSTEINMNQFNVLTTKLINFPNITIPRGKKCFAKVTADTVTVEKIENIIN